METKWPKWYAMTSHVIAYRLLELLFGMHTFHFDCFFEDFNCLFTQIRCLSRVLYKSKNIVFFCLKIFFTFTNSADPDEMQHSAAFHLGLQCLQKYLFKGFQNTES